MGGASAIRRGRPHLEHGVGCTGDDLLLDGARDEGRAGLPRGQAHRHRSNQGPLHRETEPGRLARFDDKFLSRQIPTLCSIPQTICLHRLNTCEENNVRNALGEMHPVPLFSVRLNRTCIHSLSFYAPPSNLI